MTQVLVYCKSGLPQREKLMARGKGKFKCPKCDRTFGMAAHLGRHLKTIHGEGGPRKAKKKKGSGRGPGRPKGSGRGPGRPKGSGRGPGRPKGSGKKKRAVGRPTGLVSRLGLRDMSLEQLGEVIAAARNEAQHKLVEYQQAFT
jgi:hypothetical protein